MTLDLLEQELTFQGHRRYTIECHLRRVRQIFRECEPLTEANFRTFLLSKLQNNRKASSLNRLILSVRHYGRVYDIEWCKKYPLIKKIEATQKEIFSDEEIESIISLEKPAYFHHEVWARWTMWLKILAFSGMRASEVSSLTVEQIDWGTNNFILPKTKTVPRRVPIASNIKADLKEYLKTVTTFLFPMPGPLGHVWRQAWQRHLDIRMKALGIKRPNLTTHSFRHSFISNLWEEGAPLPDIMSIVGHRKAETTLQYSHLGNKSAQTSINKHSIVRKSVSAEDLLEQFVEEAQKRGMLKRDKFTWNITDQALYIEIRKP